MGGSAAQLQNNVLEKGGAEMAEIIQEQMSMYDKLQILSDAAKYDVACTSSGVDRQGDGTGMGNCKKAGICHSFSADGRCISLIEDFIYE